MGSLVPRGRMSSCPTGRLDATMGQPHGAKPCACSGAESPFFPTLLILRAWLLGLKASSE